MSQRGDPRLTWGAIWVACGLYAGSLFLPALEFEGREPEYGWWVLAVGWAGLALFNFAWFANPCFLMAIGHLYHGNPKKAFRYALVGFILALDSFLLRRVYFNELSPTAVLGLGLGFYVWLGSFIVIVAASVMLEKGADGSPSM